MDRQANCANFARCSTAESNSFELRSVLSQLQQRGVSAGADDLQEAEAIDRRPLERFGKTIIDRFRGLASDLFRYYRLSLLFEETSGGDRPLPSQTSLAAAE